MIFPDWLALEKEVQAAIIGAVSTLVSAFLGGILIFWQIGRQAKNAVIQNNINEANKIKIDIYDQVFSIDRDAGDVWVGLISHISTFTGMLPYYVSEWNNGRKVAPFSRVDDLTKRSTELREITSKINNIVAKWIVIDERLKIFTVAFSVASQRFEAAYRDYFDKAFSHYPNERKMDAEKVTVLWDVPNSEKLAEINEAGKSVIDAVFELRAYMSDFRTEMQNLLMEGIFEGKSEPRKPKSEKHLVITLKNAKSVEERLRGAQTILE